MKRKTLFLNFLFIALSVAYMCFFPFQWDHVQSTYDFTYRRLHLFIFQPAFYAGCCGIFTHFMLTKGLLSIPEDWKTKLRIIAVSLLIGYCLYVILSYYISFTLVPMIIRAAVMNLRVYVVSIAMICLAIGNE